MRLAPNPGSWCSNTGRVRLRWKNTLSTPNRDSNPDLSAIGSPVSCESDDLDQEWGNTSLHRLLIGPHTS
uniref:(California timema) hypothetical protein n=1 Tax=Timema californicum TaxID=61474 RepID=A0A7R9IX37_TIMCA|nr:unnamed protein product [Timema californicum]